MKNVRQLILMASLGLLLCAACSRRELLDDYPVVTVQIGLCWDETVLAGGAMPEGMRAIFYPHDPAGRKVDVYLPVNGGEVKIPPGHYSVVVYNYDTETVLIRGEEAYETIEAYTNFCRLEVAGTEKMVWGPDALYTTRIDDVEIDGAGEPVLLDVTPRLVVSTHPFNLKTVRLDNVGSAYGSVEGMADCYLLGKGCGKNGGSPVYFDVEKGDGVLKGAFTTFGMPGVAVTRADEGVTMKLTLIKVDRSVQKVEIDITQTVVPPGGQEEGKPAPEISLPEGSVIEVEEVAPVPDGGGFGGEVGEWGNETEVELPMN